MYSFKSSKHLNNLTRAYALKHCYQQTRAYQKNKQQHGLNPLISPCIIIRKSKIKNQTDFGYKQELKTNILKKIHFIYLESIEDLIAFLWKHLQLKQMNIEHYFGQNFDFKECGTSFLIVIKLLRLIANKIRIKGRVCYTYCFNHQIFCKRQYQQFLRNEDIVDWQLKQKCILKQGQLFEKDQTRHFFQVYAQPQAVKVLQNNER